MTGTHQGEFNGIPATGKQVKVMGISIWHFDENGQNVKEYELLDGVGLLTQLGVLPAPEAA
jgi:predicted ester cyclase